MIIIVMGLPGSGKSFFADKLAQEIRAEYINSDRIRKDNKKAGKYSLEDKLLIYTEMLSQAENELKAGKSVVLDATFYLQKMRAPIYILADKLSVPVFLFLIEAEESVIKERTSKSREESEADFEVYLKVKENFEEPTTPHLKLQSTQDNISIMLQKAIQYIQYRHEREGS